MNKFYSSQEILRQLRQQRDETTDIYITVPLQPARTLLLMGPTRAGKSTISRALRDSLYEPERPTLYSGTRTPEAQQIGGLRIIDMPGFNDLQTQNRNSSLSDKSILTMLRKQLDTNDPVHLVAFVFSLSDGIKQEDINAMLFVRSNLPHLAKRTMLVVTHAEELNNDEKNQLVEEFFNHPNVRQHNLRSFFKKDILFVGCLRYESLNQKDYTALVNEHQNVLEMRKKFIKKCFENVPSSNKQQFTSSYLTSRSARFYLLLFFTFCALYLTNDWLGNGITPLSNVVDSIHSSTIEDNTTSNDTFLDHKEDSNEQILLDTNVDNAEDQDSTSLSNFDRPPDDALTNSTTEIGQFESNLATNELLYKILVQIEKLTQALEIQSNNIAAIKRHLDDNMGTSKKIPK